MKSASIADLLDRLTRHLQGELNQRIEQIEFKIDYPQRLQDCIDLVETLRRNLNGQSCITCLRLDLDGSSEYVITTDLEWANQYVANIRAEIIAEEPIKEVIEREYGGIAGLTFLEYMTYAL